MLALSPSTEVITELVPLWIIASSYVLSTLFPSLSSSNISTSSIKAPLVPDPSSLLITFIVPKSPPPELEVVHPVSVKNIIILIKPKVIIFFI